MKLGHILIFAGFIVGAFVAFWLLSQRRVPTLRVSYTLGRGSDISLDWLQLE